MAIWMNVSGPGHYKTYRNNTGAAKTKGTPEVQSTLLVFPFDAYAAGADQVFVYAAEQVRVYWDGAASKVTNVSAGNTKIGRCLENKNLSGGVAAGDTLLFELDSGA
jgi:hypothetical protein